MNLSLVRHLSALCLVVVCPMQGTALAQEDSGSKIVGVEIYGNHAVQADAIKGLMDSRVGGNLNPQVVRQDIMEIFESGFFDDVRIGERSADGGVILVVEVKEKPIIGEIAFEGFHEVKSDSLNDKLQSKQYTIVDEKKLTADLRAIEQSYVEKGHYLARADYELRPGNPGEVTLVFRVTENQPVTVGNVNIVGNTHFSDDELKGKLLTSEKMWASWLNSTGVFRDEFIGRDKEFLAEFYKDHGFIDVEVGAPQSVLERSRQRVAVEFSLNEGDQFHIGKISVTGDMLFPEAEILEKLKLKNGDLFRISRFREDMKTLMTLYGDQGYAFANPVPKLQTNRDTKIVDIEWKMEKGEKVYFRRIAIEGNSKTRDNVIRRNLKMAEGERFSLTAIDESQAAINRLGYFKTVDIKRTPDMKTNEMDLLVKVEEKPTAQLNAGIGASPTRDNKLHFTGQGSYNETNFLGMGWSTRFSFNIARNDEVDTPNWGLSLSFTEPSIDDGPWSFTVYTNLNFEYSRPFENEPIRKSERLRGGISVGRELIPDLRVSLGYSYEAVRTTDINPLYAFATESGDTERITQQVVYDKTNNYMFPTGGYYLSASNTFATKVFGGDHQFGAIDGTATLYVPVPIFEDYETNFRFTFEPAMVYSLGNKRIPIWERLRLGNMYTMKAYQSNQIAPRLEMLDSPLSSRSVTVIKGGNRRLYGAAEYFFPIMPEVNLRFVSFLEAGTVLDDHESFSWDAMRYDVGFGFRWLTPVAPFRFEWAWPLEKGRIAGNGEFVFTVGYDSASSF